MQELTVVQEIARTLDDKKAGHIAAFDISKLTVEAEYMIIASGRSVNQVNALVDYVEERMKELNQPLFRADGPNSGRWAVLDYGGILVEIFHQEERDYYNLDRLWDDGTNRIDLYFDDPSLQRPAIGSETQLNAERG